MTFHAYFRYVCLFLTCLYMVFSAHMHAQEYRQRSDTTRTLLIIDGETGNPIEGAGVFSRRAGACQLIRRNGNYSFREFLRYSPCTESGV